MNLTAQIFLGLTAGAFFGIFFGDLSSKILFIGQAYVNLLQMSVLPYMVVSLVHGIGSLTPKQAKRFVTTGGISLLIF
ncbi:MAG: cation:dicarboxylase symporter family transporter, partial [Deltaproteobacteria bacterium]